MRSSRPRVRARWYSLRLWAPRQPTQALVWSTALRQRVGAVEAGDSVELTVDPQPDYGPKLNSAFEDVQVAQLDDDARGDLVLVEGGPDGGTFLWVYPNLTESGAFAVNDSDAIEVDVLGKHVAQAGSLVDPGKPEVLAEAVAFFLKNPQRAAEMGRAGFERLKSHFSMKQNLDQTLQVYAEVLGPARATRNEIQAQQV